MSLNIIRNFLTKNRCYQQNVKRKPIGIQIHTIGTGQGTAKAVCDYWNQSGVNTCTTYICDADVSGRVYQMLPEDVYSWADAGYGNRNLITIEIAESDFIKYTSGANYTIINQENFKRDIFRGYDTAVQLCADICKRYKWDPMKKLPSGLYLISSHDEGRRAGLSTAHVDPTHVWDRFGLTMNTFRQAVVNAMNGKYADDDTVTTTWFRVRKTWEDVSSQIGAYVQVENAKKACPYGYSVFNEDGKVVYTNKTKPAGTQASIFQGISEGKAAEWIIEMIHECDESGILYSVTAAQMILESGYVKTALAKAANNCFGMKKVLSGNTWESVWDGKSTVAIDTQEWNGKQFIEIKADFRKYPCIEDSIADHSAYLLGAMNGSKKRYEGLLKCKNYREAITLIKAGRYATDPNYVDKICSIIQRYSLDRYDAEIAPKEETPAAKPKYIIQCGVFTKKTNATTYAKRIKDAGFHSDVETLGHSRYRVVSRRKKDGKPFAKKSTAESRAKKIQAAGFAAPLIKEV